MQFGPYMRVVPYLRRRRRGKKKTSENSIQYRRRKKQDAIVEKDKTHTQNNPCHRHIRTNRDCPPLIIKTSPSYDDDDDSPALVADGNTKSKPAICSSSSTIVDIGIFH